MTIVGLLGGVASGKSLVAKMLSQLGAVILDGDAAGHAVLRDVEIESAIRKRWGDRVFFPDGRIRRRAVAEIVFSPPPDGPRELAFLEQLTHPMISARLDDQIERCRRDGTAVAVLDAAVMLKAGWDRRCDRLIYVDAPRDVRVARAAKERGWTEEEFAWREQAQESLDAKRQAADEILDNSGSTDRLQAQVEQAWRRLIRPESKPELD